MKYVTIDPMAAEVIQELRQHYLLSLVSNMLLPGKLLCAKLRQANLDTAFQTISVSSDMGFIKPHPEIFLRTLQRDHLQPAQVIFVGDTYQQDIRGAQQVGMKTIWLNSRGVDRKQAWEHPPDAEIQMIQELLRHPFLTSP